MTNPTPLSPAAQAVLDAATERWLDAAQAVLDAATERWLDVDDDIPAQVAVAALRAVADQMVPVEAEIDPLKAWSIEDWNYMNATKYQREKTRRQLLAIATELENH